MTPELEEIEKFCETAMLQMWDAKSEIMSHLLYLVEMDGEKRMVYMPYIGDDKGALQKHALQMLGLMKVSGVFRAVCLVGEAWTSSIPKDQAALMDVMRPRHDPDRKECVFVSVWKDNEKSFKGWEIKRDKDGKGKLELIKDWDRSTSNNESWLDKAMMPIDDVPEGVKKTARKLLDKMLNEKGEKIK